MSSATKSLSGCVLLDQCAISWDEFRLQLFDDWKVEVEGECNETELDFSINGVEFVCMLMDQQVGLAIENANKNYSWYGAAQAIAAHKAHVQIYLLECENDLQRHVLFSMVASSMLKQDGAIGLYQYPITRKAEDYIEQAERMNKDELPILNWVYIGLYRDASSLWNAYTYGMEEFGKEDMEILQSAYGLVEVYKFMSEAVTYLISNDAVMAEGLPVGQSVTGKYSIARSEGRAIDGTSVKITLA